MSAGSTLSSQDQPLTNPAVFAAGAHIEFTGPARRAASHQLPGCKSVPVRETPF